MNWFASGVSVPDIGGGVEGTGRENGLFGIQVYSEDFRSDVGTFVFHESLLV